MLDVVAAHHKLPEGLDDLARRGRALLPVQQNAAAGGDVQRQPEERQQQQQRGKDAQLDGAANLHRGEKDDDRRGHRKRQQKVQRRGRQRHQHDEDHADGHQRQHVLAQPLPGSTARASVPAARAVVLIADLLQWRNAGARPAAAGRLRPARAPGCGLAGAPLAHLGLHPLAVEIGQNGGHRGIEIDRNRLAHLDRAVERAGQRRVLDDRHSRPARLGLDLLGQQIPSLGQHLGRFHGGEIKAQCHGIVRGIGQHHGGLRHIGLHPAAAHLRAAGCGCGRESADCLRSP